MAARKMNARLEFRTTLDQAGRIAGLAGELEIPESQVLRLLIERQLEGNARQLLRELRKDVAAAKERSAEDLRQEGVHVHADDLEFKS